MTASEIEYAAKKFRSFTDCLQIYDQYREPDFKDNHKELYVLCNLFWINRHFELVSFLAACLDEKYVKYLSSIRLKKAQLTIFGNKKRPIIMQAKRRLQVNITSNRNFGRKQDFPLYTNLYKKQ